MKKWIVFLSFTLCFQFLTAHPGIGIVKDTKGNIYYTDVKQIWKIERNGKRTIIVPNVHSHELYMDSADNLYGEHLWYNGERLNTWGHYVWCLKNDGCLLRSRNRHPDFWKTTVLFVTRKEICTGLSVLKSAGSKRKLPMVIL